MDTSKYFDNEDEGKEMSALERVMKELAEESLVEPGEEDMYTDEQRQLDQDWFANEYGDGKKFIFDGYRKLKSPYRNAIHKALSDVAGKKGGETASIPLSGVVDVAQEMLSHMILQGTSISKEEMAHRGAEMSAKIVKITASGKIDDQLMGLFAALTTVDLLLAEIVATNVAEHRIVPDKGVE